MNRERLILIISGLLAIALSIFGFSAFDDLFADTETRNLERECYKIIDAAQLYYARPAAFGGGNGSFLDMDAHKLGFTDKPESVAWTGDSGLFLIANRQQFSFDIVAIGNNGVKLAAVNVSFDTRPKLIRQD